MTTSGRGHDQTEQMSRALRWALDAGGDAAMASADWLAADINAEIDSAVALVTDSGTTLADLHMAKSAYKTMRLVGETAADRRTGARLYLAAIASALVHYEQRISGQSQAAMLRALRGMIDDPKAPAGLRDLAKRAVVCIESGMWT